MVRRRILAIALCLAGSLAAGALEAAPKSTFGTTGEPASCAVCRACNVGKKSGCGNSSMCTAECNRACTDCAVRGFTVFQSGAPKANLPAEALPSTGVQPQ